MKNLYFNVSKITYLTYSCKLLKMTKNYTTEKIFFTKYLILSKIMI